MIPTDMTFDSQDQDADRIAAEIAAAIGIG
jgi:hypothetical protein